MEGRQGDRCSARVYSPLAAFAAIMSFRLRRVSLQKQADGAGFTSWLPSNVAELVLPLAIAIHLFPSPWKDWQSSPAQLPQMLTPGTQRGQGDVVCCEQSGFSGTDGSAGLSLRSLLLVHVSSSSKLACLLGNSRCNTSSCP